VDGMIYPDDMRTDALQLLVCANMKKLRYEWMGLKVKEQLSPQKNLQKGLMRNGLLCCIFQSHIYQGLSSLLNSSLTVHL